MKAWDTNFLLRHLLEDDEAQLAVVRRELQLVESGGGSVFLPVLVLVETAWNLRALMPRPNMLDTLREVLDDRRFTCELADEVGLAIQRARKKGDFSDHLIAASAKRSGALPVQTFDTSLRAFPAFEHFKAPKRGNRA